ncbi:MAG TPA: ubiquinol oxidase subunit II [Caulobacteraceae bacterium]|nr:ubiquinol oxidase subunit II [Caulobacteraceae bacterium]
MGQLALGLVVALPLGACDFGILDPQGPVGRGERTILFDSVALMLTIVAPTILATFAFAWWFRASNPKARRLPDWEFSGALELLIWAVPLLTIMFLGGMTWIASFDLDPYKPLPSKTPPLEVQAVSLDWKWLFIYPGQQVASVNQLVLPAGTPVHFSLTSSSVMNAFFVPRLGSMIYTMNGMATQLNLEADRPGVFHGLSSHFSGDGFPGMHFSVRATSPADFAAWVAATRAGAGPVLDGPAYTALARQSSNVAPFAYRAVAPGLFQSILTQQLPPGPGPSGGDVQVSPKSSTGKARG